MGSQVLGCDGMSTSDTMEDVMDVTVEDHYRSLDQWLRRFKHMNLARWKILQQTVISILVGYLAIGAGADPTIAIGVIAVINGISFADLATVWNSATPKQNQDDEKRER